MERDLFEPEHHSFRESVREFISREVTPRLDAMKDERTIPREVWLAAGEQGLLGLEVPGGYGGSEAEDYRFNAVLLEELARVNMALPSAVGIHADIVAPYLVKLTGEEQRRRWLPGVVDGSRLLAIAMTEPSGGSDLAALRTTAVRDGEGWVLSGAKTFITNGASADLVITAACTTAGAGAKGITLFAVEADREGFSRGRKLSKVGQDEADTAELFFDRVRVTEADLIGEVDRGFAHMMACLPQERLGAAVTNLAHADQIFIETVAYCRDRQVFGQSVGSWQHNKHLLADLATELTVGWAFIDRCIEAHNHARLSVSDAAKAKLWTSEVQNRVLDHCVQLHGGYGYMNEYRVAQAWKDARVTKIWAGSNEIMREIIGRELTR